MGRVEDFRRLTEEIANAYRERVSRISAIKQDVWGIKRETAGLLKDFDKAHADMSKALRAEFSKGRSDLKDTVSKMMDDFDKAHADMAKALKAEFSKLREKLSKVKPGLKEADSKMKADVRKMMDDFRNVIAHLRKEQAETAAAWKVLLSTMQAKRGIRAKVKPEVAVRPEKVEKDLKGQVLKTLRQSPGGLSMTQIGDILGLENWRTLIPVMRALLDKGKARKEDSLYFAVE